MAGGGTAGAGGAITGINITPLVDVCLVLVIIFMVTAPLLEQPTLPVELPKAATQKGKDTDNVTLTVTKDGKWALNADELPPQALEAALARKVAESRDRYVIIRADRGAPYAYVLEGLRLARAAGARDFAIATEQSGRARP